DLERIVEIRVGQPALWAVADEDCLPNGTKRLFAIVFYKHMELKTICMVAQSDEDFSEWMDTLTCLLTSRQAIRSTSQFQRWRMVMLCRQWWWSDQSNQSATDALQCIEAAVCDKDAFQHTATTVTSYPLPISRVPHVRSEQLLDEMAMQRALTPPKSSGMRKWLPGSSGGGGPSKSPSLGSVVTFSSLATSPVQRHSSQQVQQQHHQLGRDDWVLGAAESIYTEHPQRSFNTLYEDIALTFVNSPASQFANAAAALSASVSGSSSVSNSEGSDSDSDELTMNGSRSRRRRMPLHLEMPKGQSFGVTLAVFGRFLREVQKEE
ncbi:hypothetical protein EV175_006321, partial [Coemansia sp. RSA 1933]